MANCRTVLCAILALAATSSDASPQVKSTVPDRGAVGSRCSKTDSAEPATLAQLVHDIWAAAQSTILFQSGFYSDENLKTFFCATTVNRWPIDRGNPNPFQRYHVSGFSRLFASQSRRPQVEGLPFIEPMNVAVSVRPNSELIASVFISVRLQDDINDPDLEIERITQVLGGNSAGWREDGEAERNYFIAVSREPWNPADAVNAARHTRFFVSVTNDATIERRMTLQFAPSGHLTSLELSVSRRKGL